MDISIDTKTLVLVFKHVLETTENLGVQSPHISSSLQYLCQACKHMLITNKDIFSILYIN